MVHIRIYHNYQYHENMQSDFICIIVVAYIPRNSAELFRHIRQSSFIGTGIIKQS